MKFDKRQLLKKLQKNPTEDIYEEIVNYCKQNVNYFNWKLKNFEDKVLITAASSYLMKYKTDKWDLKDAVFMTYFFGYTAANNFGIVDKIKIKVISESTFEKKYEKADNGICIYNNDKTCTVFYSSKLSKQLKNKNSRDFINGIQSIIFQIVDAFQNIIIHDNQTIEPYNRDQYIMALEDVAKSTNEDLYENSYVTSYRKSKAELEAIDFTISILQEYKKNNILEKNKRFITIKKAEYQEKQSEFEQDNIELSAGPVSKTELNARMSLYLIPELLEQYPILQVAFDENGHKKRINTLLKERRIMLKISDEDTVNELYNCILAETLIYGESKKSEKELSGLPKEIIGEPIKKQQLFLKQYIAKNGNNDKFAEDLLNIFLSRQKQGEQKSKKYKKTQQIVNTKKAIKKDKAEQKNKSIQEDFDIINTKKRKKKKSNDYDNEFNEEVFKFSTDNINNKQNNKNESNKKRSTTNEISNKQSTAIGINNISEEEYNNFIQRIQEARKEGYMEAMKKLSDEMNHHSPCGGYIAAAPNTQTINPYFKDYMDKIEFEEHMKKVAEAKRRGDKKMLKVLSSEMIDKSGYGLYLSNEVKIQPINLYFKEYMDKRERS